MIPKYNIKRMRKRLRMPLLPVPAKLLEQTTTMPALYNRVETRVNGIVEMGNNFYKVKRIGAFVTGYVVFNRQFYEEVPSMGWNLYFSPKTVQLLLPRVTAPKTQTGLVAFTTSEYDDRLYNSQAYKYLCDEVFRVTRNIGFEAGEFDLRRTKKHTTMLRSVQFDLAGRPSQQTETNTEVQALGCGNTLDLPNWTFNNPTLTMGFNKPIMYSVTKGSRLFQQRNGLTGIIFLTTGIQAQLEIHNV